MRITEIYKKLVFNSGSSTRLFKIAAPYEGLVTKFVVEQVSGALNGYTARLLSNPNAVPDNDITDTYVKNFSDEVLSLITLTAAPGTASVKKISEYGYSYRNLRGYDLPSVNLNDDYFLYVKIILPSSATSNINFDVGITILTYASP